MPDLLFTSRGPTRELRARRPRAGLRVLGVALILAGALALADAAVTLVWQEPVSALYASLRQHHLTGALKRVERAAPTPRQLRRLASIGDERRRIAFLARELERHAADGSAVGRIEIPRLDASFVVVNGTSTEDLEGGPGIFRAARFPGIPGTTTIAGHRTTFLAPFRHIDALTPGSTIHLVMPYAGFTYTVIGQSVVEPSAVQSAVGNVGYSRLVLSACTPLFSAAKRLLVFARLTRIVPRGAARRLPGGALARSIEVHPRSHGSALALPPVLKPSELHGTAGV